MHSNSNSANLGDVSPVKATVWHINEVGVCKRSDSGNGIPTLSYFEDHRNNICNQVLFI